MGTYSSWRRPVTGQGVVGTTGTPEVPSRREEELPSSFEAMLVIAVGDIKVRLRLDGTSEDQVGVSLCKHGDLEHIAQDHIQVAFEYDEYIEEEWTGNDPCIDEKAHQKFIELYPKVFYKEKTVLPRIPEAHLKRIPKPVNENQTVDEKYHDIGSYLKKIRGIPRNEQESLQKREHVDMLIRILNKVPILRTAREHKIVYRMMKLIPDINVQLSDAELKELSMSTIKEHWEKGSTVVGNQGFYAILKGSVRPQGRLYKRMLGENFDSWAMETSPEPSHGSSSDLSDQELLVKGSCFGTLETLPSKLQKIQLSIITEEDCEILKIPCSEYLRVREDVAKRERSDKEELIRSCSYYHAWPQLYILQLAPHLQWRQFPAGHELVKAGEISSFIGFISSGFCNIYREVKALVELPQRKRVRRNKKVCMGQLHRNDSFGEVSILLQVPFTCTIVTATAVKLGIIDAAAVLDGCLNIKANQE
ncbi:cyclic nucleotide-binding domain-containing protein 1 [Nothoprocta perdicaria]|uniref:cyclic nucleotide-binding domain-containing protein 1 n=1 Tax=Nothoprocta perdicaria TaxID=30464 RepID=UPI000E1B76B8|nr:cyclic nucleotide-binding domain-containing protein 1 [Nothoprocta perdicaria]